MPELSNAFSGTWRAELRPRRFDNILSQTLPQLLYSIWFDLESDRVLRVEGIHKAEPMIRPSDRLGQGAPPGCQGSVSSV